MLRVGFVPLVVTAVTLSGSIVSAAPVPQPAATPQQPTVSDKAFRVDLATGGLIPLESAKSKKESQSRGNEYCYVEGAQSPVTIRRDEPLVFAARLEGSPKDLAYDLDRWRRLSIPVYKLEFLFVSDEERRYATGKYVPMDGEPYGEVLSGVNPKRRNDVGQAVVFRPRGPLASGEYALTIGGMFVLGTCGGAVGGVSAFRIVDAPIATRTAPSTPPPTAAPPADTPLSPEQMRQLRQDADSGQVRAQGLLGFAYLNGDGVAKDFAQAAQWFRMAADQGDAIAQFMLGSMYLAGGPGVLQDFGQAALWFREGAEQGFPGAQFFLGSMYRDGSGVNQDAVEAHKWLNLAATLEAGDQQKTYADTREALAATMKRDEVAEAQKRARDWMTAFNRRKNDLSVAAPPLPLPPPPTPPGAIRVGGNIPVPRKIKDAEPAYPAIAQAARVEGDVIIEATVGTDGKVLDATVLKSIPLLDFAALDAVRQWEFAPTLMNGIPVPVIMTVTVSFSLK